MAESLFTDIINNLGKAKKEGKISGGYRYEDGKLNVGGGYYGDDSMFEININKDGGNILFKKRFAGGGLAEEYYGKDKLDWMENYSDQMTFEEYLRYKRTGSFADGGSTNGSEQAAFRAKVEELMDDGYDFGEAVREAMRQGYDKGGRVAMYKGGDPELQKLYKELVKKQPKRSLTMIGWDKTKLTNLKNYLAASGKTLDQYLKMTPADRNKVNKAELKGMGKGKNQKDVPSVKAFKKWLAKQNPLTLKADNLQELVKKAKIPSVRMGKGSRLVGINMQRIAQIMEENPQFTGVKKRDWQELKVQDKVTNKHLGTDNPKYSGVYEQTSKTGKKTYYVTVQRDNKDLKVAVKSPADGIKKVKELRKTPTVKEKVGEITLEERDRFKKKKTKEQIATDKKRSKALKERSSFPFEKATKGDIKTVGGHTGSIYAEDVTPETKRYTPTKINQVLENYDNVLNNITKKRDAAILAGDAAEVERLNTKGMKYASLTKGFKTFTVKQIDGTGFVFGQTSRAGLADPGGFMKPGMTAKDVTTFGTAYGGKNPQVMRAKFVYKNALEKQEGKKIKITDIDKYSPKTAEAITAKNNLTRINKIEAAKLFDEGTNKALLDFQKESSMKSIEMNKKQARKVSNQILNDFKKVQKLEKTLKVRPGFIVNRLNSGIPMDEILSMISKNSNMSLSTITNKAMTALRDLGKVDYSKMQLGSGNLAKAAGVVKNAAKFLGKTAAVVGVPLTAFEMKNMYGEGKTAAEMLAYPFFLEGRVGEAQDLLKMTPVERQAIKNEQIADDFSMMDTDFYTPPLEGVEAVDTEMVKERVAKERAKEEEERKALRNKTLPNEGLLRILSNPKYEGVL